MKRGLILSTWVAWVVWGSIPASAHFGMVIPSDPMVMQSENRTVQLTLAFCHPFERQGLDLAQPKRFGVQVNGRTEDLSVTLAPIQWMGHAAWQTDYTLKRPGAHLFYMEPQPYWEPAEDCFIVHYTKTVVAAFGDDEGWDAEIGLKTEIVPLARPIGLYAGNVFQGIVKVDRRSVPFATVEIEYYNPDGKVRAPNDLMITQTVKADANGVFTYAAPWAGWWGFAALNAADEKISRDGQDKEVELGAVLWVRFLRGATP